MALSKIGTNSLEDLSVTSAKVANDGIGPNQLDETANYAFTGTITGAGGTNTPAFSAYRSSDQNAGSGGVINKIIMDTEIYDTDNAYDTSNGRFTVPAGKGGKYHFDIVTNPYEIANNNMTYTRTQIYVNGSNQLFSDIAYPSHTGYFHAGVMSVDINLSAGDYVEFYSRIGATGTHMIAGTLAYGRISGHKIIT